MNVNLNVNLKFTSSGKTAIGNFTNDELLEIFKRYMNTLMKKHDISVSIMHELNPSIAESGVLRVLVTEANCDVDAFFKELGRDIKVPLKKRIDGKLDTVFTAEKKA